MVWVDHATLLHPDGRQTRINRVEVNYSGNEPSVQARKIDTPPWDSPGIDVIAARNDGSIECSFTVGRIRTVALPGSSGALDPLIARRVYLPSP